MKRKKFTLKQKNAVLNLTENNVSCYEIEIDYGINRKSIKDWESQKDKISNSFKKKSFRLEGRGRKTCIKGIEQEIIFWIHIAGGMDYQLHLMYIYV